MFLLTESLRKYPPLGTLLRTVTQPYPVPNSKVVLPVGAQVMIPVYAIQHDPDIYPNPDLFDPDRFSQEEVAKRDKATFLAFGDGPRNCIGLRFGMMQTRVGLVSLLLRHEFTRSAQTTVPIVFSRKTSFLSPEAGMSLNVRRI